MSSRLRVYGWRAARKGKQTREIMAAASVAEVMRRTGLTRGEWKHSGAETRNREEIAIATAQPGRLFWRPLNQLESDRDWESDGEPA